MCLPGVEGQLRAPEGLHCQCPPTGHPHHSPGHVNRDHSPRRASGISQYRAASGLVAPNATCAKRRSDRKNPRPACRSDGASRAADHVVPVSTPGMRSFPSDSCASSAASSRNPNARRPSPSAAAANHLAICIGGDSPQAGTPVALSHSSFSARSQQGAECSVFGQCA